MHYYPQLVKLDTAGNGASNPWSIASINKKTAWAPRNWQQASEDTGIGNPHKSTAEKGKRYAQEVTRRIADLLIELADI